MTNADVAGGLIDLRRGAGIEARCPALLLGNGGERESEAWDIDCGLVEAGALAGADGVVPR